ncbi:MAG TPA: hypothetical protein VKD72_03375, partial [Gemmataceae bacterium]|nr:hypothetical protein [Gemmataceae bacterium]
VGGLVQQWAQEEDDRGNRAQGERLTNAAAMGYLVTVPPCAAVHDEAEAACARVLAEPEWQPGALTVRLEEIAAKYLDNQTPAQALVQLMASLEEQCWQFGGPDNPAAWASQALARVREWLGSGLQGGGSGLTIGPGNRKSRLNRALENACSQLAERWDAKLSAAAGGLMDLPGQRVAVAEAALNRLMQHFLLAAREQEAVLADHAARVARAQEQLDEALSNCSGTGFRLFGWRPQRQLRVFLDRLTALTRQCLAEDTACAVQNFLGALAARLRDRLRDLSLLRQRLRQIHEILVCPPGCEEDAGLGDEEGGVGGPEAVFSDPRPLPAGANSLSPTPMASLTSFWEISRNSTTAQVVLPDGEMDLDRAAARFVATLTAEHWGVLDQALQDEVLGPRRGLAQACFGGSDLHRYLIGPLVDRAANCLAQYLPVTDVAQVEITAAGDSDAIARRMRTSLEAAVPLGAAVLPRRPAKRDSKVLALAGGSADGGAPPPNGTGPEVGETVKRQSWLLIPASEAGKAYGEQARAILPDIHLVRVSGQADLMFCQEQGSFSQEELERLITPCRDAYLESSTVPGVSPHSRFDTRDWVPLEP